MDVQTGQWLLSNAGDVISKCLFAASLLIAGYALYKLKTIVEVVSKLNDSKSSISELRQSVQTLSDIDISKQLADLKESVEAAQKQLLEMQRHSVDERPIVTDAIIAPPIEVNMLQEENSWLKIREIWGVSRDYLEKAISTRITDGRRRRKYETMTRYNYAEIIDLLLQDGAISNSAADAAQNMNRKFLALRSRKRPAERSELDEFIEWKNKLTEVTSIKAA